MADLKSNMMNVMAALTSNDNAQRKAAEAFFTQQLESDV